VAPGPVPDALSTFVRIEPEKEKKEKNEKNEE
jgi:hypothetical protein